MRFFIYVWIKKKFAVGKSAEGEGGVQVQPPPRIPPSPDASYLESHWTEWRKKSGWESLHSKNMTPLRYAFNMI